MSKREHPIAMTHGEIRELLPDIFMVTGTMRVSGRPMSFSRNMVVIRDDESLTLVNSVRLDDHGLRALEALGSVDNVIRLAGFHGMDDPFYKERYGARVHAIRGQVYVAGFELEAEPHFTADRPIDAADELPIEGARLYVFESSKPAEAVLLLLRNGGVLISGDSLQNWQSADRYFNLVARIMMRLMGFIKPFAVGPGWQKFAKPSATDLSGILDLRFEHVLPAHGDEVIGGAKEKYRPAIEAAAKKAG